MSSTPKETRPLNLESLSNFDRSPTVASVKRRCQREGITTSQSPIKGRTPLLSRQQQSNNGLESNDWSGYQIHPQQLQQKFLQRLHNEEVQRDPDFTHQLSDCIPARSFVKTTATCASTSTNNNNHCADASLQSNDSSMFGDDIPSALLDEVLNVSQKQPPAPIAMDHVQNEANIMIGHLPQQQQQQQQQQLQQKQHDASSINKENFNYDDDDDMFGDDIPIEDLEEQLGMGRDISVPSGSGLPTINREGLDATLETKFETSDSCSNIKDTATGQRNNSRSRYQRFIIVATRLKGYMVDDSQRLERELLLVGEEHEQVTKAYLRQDWLHIRVAEGDAINIVFTNRNGHTKNNWIIDNEQNYLIHHPDHLISCTAVAESFFCLRKSVLQMTSKSISEVSEPLIHGAIIHETLQYCLKQKDFTTTAIQNAMKTIIKSTLDPLYVIGQDETTTYELLTPHITSIQTFGSIYVRQYPIPAATIKRDIGPSDTECSSLAIRDILDIEEHIWSPIYGLKGMIDATVEMILAPNNKVLTLPFELKTGRASRLISHRAQTILYTLLLGDRYDFDVNVGVLYYSKTNSLYMVPASQSEIRSLIIARNELSAAYQRQATALPPMIKNFHSCQYCTMNDACTLYHKTVESGSAMTSGLGQWFNDHTDHINDKAAIFYRQWIQLISLEEQDLDYLRKDIWNDSAKERELSGKCLKNMMIVTTQNNDIFDDLYTFERDQNDTDCIPLLSTGIMVGDNIVISSMEGDLLLGTGMVTHLNVKTISISLTAPLRHSPRKDVDFDQDNRQVFIKREATMNKKQQYQNIRYRLDKDEAAVGFALMKSNLVTLMTKDSNSSALDDTRSKLRRLIIDSASPSFSLLEDATLLSYITDLNHLNIDQQNAVKKVMTCADYALILGMPGTGKTTTTAEIIKCLIRQGKSILLTAYTHSALDNILMKLVDQGVDVLRLGNPEKVMPRIRNYMPQSFPELTTVAAMTEFYDSKQIVGATCYGTNHILFRRRRFDYCVVDEASQITLPVCVGPLQYADKFVLVGDQYQLPPIVKDKDALDGGLSESLFSMLARDHPEAIVFLEYQYRMNKDIMMISNRLFYDDKLKCGNELVGNSSMNYPHFTQGINSLHDNDSPCHMLDECWLKDILDPSRKVIFVNTDPIPATESRNNGKMLQNHAEATLVYQTTEALIRCGIKEEQIALVSVYRTQLRLITQEFGGHRPDLEIATIDKYQGRDKDCVLISLVRNNRNGMTGDLLKDWKRLNVAFTRAKRKLILFGSLSTLQHSSIFKDCLDLLQSHDWVYSMKKDAHLFHKSQLPTKIPLDHPPSLNKEQQTKKRSPKIFSRSKIDIDNRPILRDIYNYATQE